MTISDINSTDELQAWLDVFVAANRDTIEELGVESTADKILIGWDPETATLDRVLPENLQVGKRDTGVDVTGSITDRFPTHVVLEHAQEISSIVDDPRETAVAVLEANIEERIENPTRMVIEFTRSELYELIRMQVMKYETDRGNVLFYLADGVITRPENHFEKLGVAPHDRNAISYCEVGMDTLTRLMDGAKPTEWHEEIRANFPLYVGSKTDEDGELID
ncbi:hypothetical protein [Halosegnis longus]|uniref:hypothetical protein n=1 Tax=Halosegnis longus TaxID=2216012 RepID=UPI00129EF285|nr:hypothetical protein [Halosegnis longus]